MADKTLLQLLVEELPGLGGWPRVKGCNVCAQDAQLGAHKNAIAFYREPPRHYKEGLDVYWNGDFIDECGGDDVLSQLASDHTTAIITREQYEAALAEKRDKPIAVLRFDKHRRGEDGLLPNFNERPEVMSCDWLPDGEYPVYLAPKTEKPSKAAPDPTADVWKGDGMPPAGTVCEYTLNDGVDWWPCEIAFVVVTQEGQFVPTHNLTTRFRPIPTPEQIEAERRERICNAFKAAINSSPPNAYGVAGMLYDAIKAGEINGVKIEEA